MFQAPHPVPKSGKVDRYHSETYFLLFIFTEWVRLCLFLSCSSVYWSFHLNVGRGTFLPTGTVFLPYVLSVSTLKFSAFCKQNIHYICVFLLLNKQLLYSYICTALTDWFMEIMSVYYGAWVLFLNFCYLLFVYQRDENTPYHCL